MLKSLRRKFIAVSMASMGAVLALIITIMNISNYLSMRDTVSQRMDIATSVLKDEDRMFKRDGIGNPDELIFPDGEKPDDVRTDRERTEDPESRGNGGQRGPIKPEGFFGGGFGKVNMETQFDIRYFSAVSTSPSS